MDHTLRKRLLSLLLVLTMLFSMLPTVFAVEDVEDAEQISVEETLTDTEEIALPDEDAVPEDGEPAGEPVPEEGSEPVEGGEEPADPAEESGEEAADVEVCDDLADAEEPAEEAEEEDEEEERSLPYGFKGMPEGYELSEEDLAAKQAMVDHNVVATMAALQPGVDYIADEVYFLAETQEYAEAVAEAYSAELVSFEWGVAVLRLTTATALEAVTAGADPELPLPVVSQQQIITVEPDFGGGRDFSGSLSIASGEAVPARESWQSWFETATKPDPYLRDPTQDEYQYMHDLVNTYEAWGITKGFGVTVGVIDTGVASHDDLNSNVVNRAYIVGSAPYEDHGTHVAGIIAAAENNGTGGAGIAPQAKIRSYCIFNSNTYTSADLAAAINRAANDGVDVINLSLGGMTYEYSEEQALRNAINNKGVTVVVAMGNEATNIKAYPAAYNLPGLIAVGSVTEAGTRSAFSNYGSWQDVAAPGSAIMSTVPDGYGEYGSGTNSYAFMNGTSMATPVVSGVCALYISKFPNATPAQVEAAVKAATTNGIVDAAKLFSSESSFKAVENSAPDISVSGLSGGAAPYNATVTFGGILTGDAIVYTLNGKNPAIKNGVVTVGTLLNLNGSLTGTLRVTEANGFKPGKTVTVKAARVSKMSTMGKVASVTFTVGYASPASVSFVNAPAGVAAGKSITLQAAVNPAQARQSVTWSLDSAPAGVSIDARKGVLKVPAGLTGETARVRVSTTESPVRTAYTDITLGVQPVKAVTLNVPDMVFEVGTGYSSGTQKITPSAVDAGGAAVSSVTYSFTSDNTKVATVAANGTVTPVGKGKAVITVKAQDGSNAGAKCRVEVRQVVESVSVSGLSYIAPGKTAAYKASALPSSANSKSVTWSLSPNAVSQGITVSSKGVVSVPSSVPTGTTNYTVYARANDSRGTTGSLTFQVRPAATYINGIYIEDELDGIPFIGGGYILNSKNSTLKQVTLYTLDFRYYQGAPSDEYYASAQLTAYTDAPSLVWTSSNPAVATVSQSGVVTGHTPGKATITAKAPDASGKKVSTTVQVIIPASGVTVTSAGLYSEDDLKMLSVGKSVKNSARLGDAFGKPSISKVNWGYSVYVMNPYGNECTETENLIYSKKLVSVNQSGKLSTKASLKNYIFSGYNIWVTVIAETTDGTDLTDSVEYYLFFPMSKVTLEGKSSQKVTLYTEENTTLEHYSSWGYYIDSWFKMGKGLYYVDDWEYSVKSSNPDVAGAVIGYESDGHGGYYTFVQVFAGTKKGTAKITVTTADGSAKKATITVKVK